MYDMLERLIFIVLPRTRDFAGLESSSIDKEGNLVGKCPRSPKNWTSTEVVELFNSLTSAK